MLEPIFNTLNQAAVKHAVESKPESYELVRRAALLHRAIALAIESAFRFGTDLPVGAVAANDQWITGRYFASDKRLDWGPMHAEVMALIDSTYNRDLAVPNTLVVTLEPCDNCQDIIASGRWGTVQKVGFGISREEAAAKGLVKPHDEDIFDRAKRLGFEFEVFKVEDDDLSRAGHIVLDHTQRDPVDGTVRVDKEGLKEELIAFNVLG